MSGRSVKDDDRGRRRDSRRRADRKGEQLPATERRAVGEETGRPGRRRRK